MNRKYLWVIASILMLALLLTACSKTPETAKQNAPMETKKLSIGLLKLTSSAPVFIGIEKGFFKKEGLELDVQWFEAAHPIAVATASNKVDIGATGITASLYNMVAGGQKLSIVADKGREQKGYSSSALLVTSDLWGQGVQKIEQMKGKRIGITQTGSTYHYMIGRLLEAKGLSLTEVEIVPLGKMGALMAALQSNQVDAVILNEPNISTVVAAGYGKLVSQVGDVIDYQTSGIFFSPELMKDKANAVRFLKGYIKASRYYYDAVLTQKDGKIVPGTNYDEVVGIIANYTGASVNDVKTGLPYMDRDGKLLTNDIQTQIDWYASHKMLEKPINASLVTDTALFEEALKEVK
ncbi:Putative aliphatic sulfonates-binding protein precursor [Sporomusa ovata DSM 2662]|uniref:ABC transporter periplasmic binding protein n=1 Tax=Sporomusa ovata TaxID=2378 RepID=A0A0U1KWS8_9FIRM|nr:ABC transporter substrate-binding protein [Sporomusa ovata]EQB28748.1 ABC-type nitrate/sulfonate/bicarbonate transport system periplasmic component [Sporomusa ovata DSM 2662]CQR71900.1 ABC transporter periplasmic binding protein [Sporomusa ovata]